MLSLKRTLSTALLILLTPTIGHAGETFQTELTGTYQKTDADTVTAKITDVFAEVYFSPVETANKPLAAADFLNKSSSIGAGYIKSSTDIQGSTVNKIETDGPAVIVNYITSDNAFILGAVYGQLDTSTNDNLVTGDIDILGLSIGKYLDDSTTIHFSYLTHNTDFKISATDQTITSKNNSYSITYETIQQTGNENYYRFTVSIELIKNEINSINEDNNEFLFATDYFFTNKTSLGAGAVFNSGDDIDQEGKIFFISATHFFINQLALNIEATKFLASDDLTEDETSISASLIARF